MRRLLILTLLATSAAAPPLRAQVNAAEERAVIAVADSVLAALTSGNGPDLARLVLDSAIVGGIGVRDGVERMSLSGWARYIKSPAGNQFTERGFGATARVQDRVAQAWVPYDLYIGSTWSHCGVDMFTLIKRDGRWRVASLIYTIEQPPACSKHPAGPPKP